jgi:heptosyltransferase-1
MGDILHALPAVTALRQAHPGWLIDWVVEPRWRALLAAEQPENKEGAIGEFSQELPSGAEQAAENLVPSSIFKGSVSGHDFSRAANAIESTRALAPEGCCPIILPENAPFFAVRKAQGYPPDPVRPVVNRLHLAPTRAWRKAPFSRDTLHEIRALRRALKAGSYDAVLDLQGAIRSAVVARMAGCRRVIGEAQPRERAARWLFTERVETHGGHVIVQGVELASAVAADDLKPVTPWLPVDSTAEAWVDRILFRDASRRSVLINPGAGWGAKRWPVERYAAVAQGLIDRGMRVLVNAGPGEEPLAQSIVQAACGAAPVNCTLEQLIALTRRVKLAIAGDTGPLHLACALGRPVVGIYGPTDPGRNGPFGTRFRVLRSPESRRDHTRHAAPEAGLLTILPQEVLEAADELLAEGNAG